MSWSKCFIISTLETDVFIARNAGGEAIRTLGASRIAPPAFVIVPLTSAP